ncbi:MAG: pilin [Patescibacteria group bacterium]
MIYLKDFKKILVGTSLMFCVFFLPAIAKAAFTEGGACPKMKAEQEELIKTNKSTSSITSAACKKLENCDQDQNCAPMRADEECGAEMTCCVCFSGTARKGETVNEPVGSGAGLISFNKHTYIDPMGGKTIPAIVAGIISTVLPVVGAVFLIMFIYGGFLWMTAGGDESKVKKARQTLVNTAIGILIIVGAYAIVSNILTIFNPG